jgi:hypothetical protein
VAIIITMLSTLLIIVITISIILRHDIDWTNFIITACTSDCRGYFGT